jgi:thioesterase domain-containing protein
MQPQLADETAYLLQRYEAGIAAGAANLEESVLEELKLLASAGNLDAMLVRCQETGLIPNDLDNDILRRYLAVYRATEEAVAHYTLPPIPVPLSLFYCTQRSERCQNTNAPTVDAQSTAATDSDYLLGWKKLAGGRLRLIPVGGNHLTMIEPPHVQHLGTAIMQGLTAAGNETVAHPELSYSPLVTIHNGGSDLSPLFCVPGAGASVTTFCALAEGLEATRRVYGLQPRGLEDSLVPHIDVPSAARAYISAIRAVCPHGPYQLLGHSFGGWIAFEMARRLAACGDRVSALVILDSEAPMSDAHTRKWQARVPLLLTLVEMLEFSSQRSLMLTAADFAPLDYDRQLELLLERMIAAQLMPSKKSLQALRNIVRVFAVNSNTKYVPEGVYDGIVHFAEITDMGTASADSSPEAQTAITGWRRWAPNMRVSRCPGNHLTLLAPPHCARLAEWLRSVLIRPTRN